MLLNPGLLFITPVTRLFLFPKHVYQGAGVDVMRGRKLAEAGDLRDVEKRNTAQPRVLSPCVNNTAPTKALPPAQQLSVLLSR